MPRTALPLLALTSTLTLAACGGASPDPAGTPEAAGTAAAGPDRVTVAVTPVPHADILQFVADELAPEAGLQVEIVEFTDYVQPNVALDDGSVDANYFQHRVFLADQMGQGGYDFVSLGSVSFQPMGLYSESLTDLADLAEGATVAIPNDPVNGSRGIDLLVQEGLVTLAADAPEIPTVLDIEDNPRGLQFEEVEAAQLPRSLSDVDLAAIPGNYAIGADLNPGRDALVTEAVDGTPYANQFVVRAGREDDEALRTLYSLLTGPEVRDHIEQTYDGAVVQATH
ncbi:MetQ/NlpA family ABC transporter substrate-binding protein [Ornithinimicrobium flavum]|uniref:MetQ/NlpA family ABC transporter substrate-binding protein n=1 Tax=Ornithinimicrobium flavum TaxID=1288636 RepID=UPI00106FBCCE|nr:MetQ/NlpA family ABC transporter substrate-binding protein [Ornithinimicrobium flavum]